MSFSDSFEANINPELTLRVNDLIIVIVTSFFLGRLY